MNETKIAQGISQRDSFLNKLAAMKLRAAIEADKAAAEIKATEDWDARMVIARERLVPAQDEVARLEREIAKLLETSTRESWGFWFGPEDFTPGIV